jgi:hypothetical protein
LRYFFCQVENQGNLFCTMKSDPPQFFSYNYVAKVFNLNCISLIYNFF